jgi:hypothetical protein
MPHDIKESDWKIFRQLHEIALDRFYQRAVAKLGRVQLAKAKEPRDRFWQLAKLLDEEKEELSRLFDDFRRSTSLIQLAFIVREDLLTEDEFSRFSPDAREYVQRCLTVVMGAVKSTDEGMID